MTRRRRTNPRALVAGAALLCAGSVLVVSDLRARGEIRETRFTAQSMDRYLVQARLRLTATQSEVRSTGAQVEALQASISQLHSSVASAHAADSSTEQALAAAGYDISALTTCLGGVTRAIDQLAVGQQSGTVSSLASASKPCSALKTTGG